MKRCIAILRSGKTDQFEISRLIEPFRSGQYRTMTFQQFPHVLRRNPRNRNIIGNGDASRGGRRSRILSAECACYSNSGGKGAGSSETARGNSARLKFPVAAGVFLPLTILSSLRHSCQIPVFLFLSLPILKSLLYRRCQNSLP